MRIVVRDPVVIALLASFIAPAGADPGAPAQPTRHLAIGESGTDDARLKLNLGSGTAFGGSPYATLGVAAETRHGWRGWVDRRSDGPTAVGVAFTHRF